MSSASQFETAWEGIEKSWQAGQLAHAYLLQGSPYGAALRFALSLAQPGARSDHEESTKQASTWARRTPTPASRQSTTTRRPLPRTTRSESSVVQGEPEEEQPAGDLNCERFPCHVIAPAHGIKAPSPHNG